MALGAGCHLCLILRTDWMSTSLLVIICAFWVWWLCLWCWKSGMKNIMGTQGQGHLPVVSALSRRQLPPGSLAEATGECKLTASRLQTTAAAGRWTENPSFQPTSPEHDRRWVAGCLLPGVIALAAPWTHAALPGWPRLFCECARSPTAARADTVLNTGSSPGQSAGEQQGAPAAQASSFCHRPQPCSFPRRSAARGDPHRWGGSAPCGTRRGANPQIPIPEPGPPSPSWSPDPGQLRGSGAGRAGRGGPGRSGDPAPPE